MNTAHSSKQIIIIGAGMAGLSAYHHLHQHGFDVMLLEARHRAGGRICTNYNLGIPVNNGAGWIHGIEGNPISQLARQTGTGIKKFDYQKYIKYDRNGSPIKPELIHLFDEKFEHLLQDVKKVAFESKIDMPLSVALANVMPLNGLTNIEHDLFQSKLQYFEGYIGTNYELLSARYWNLEEAWPGDNCYVTSTYQPIIDHLTANCNIRFNSIVKEINLRRNDVEIITNQATFYADFVVITLPLGVLQKNDVQFSPPLPTFKQTAIHRLGMGLLNVTYIKFPTAFWLDDYQAFALTSNDKASILMFFNLYDFLGQPILMGYHGGQRARYIEKLTEEELTQLIMRDLKNIFGKNIPEPEKLITTRWSQDVFTYGSYSYLSVNASADDYDALAHPIANRLFFAGEATHSRFLATTHGAYLSGVREANRIKQLIV